MAHPASQVQPLKELEFGSRPPIADIPEGTPHAPELPNDAIHFAYPTPGSVGDYRGVLPSLILNAPSLPYVSINGRIHHWLALLLFDESELAAGKVQELTVTQAQLPHDQVWFDKEKYLVHNFLQIKVEADLLEEVLPDNEGLSMLTHLVTTTRTGSPRERSRVSILSGRLPKPGSRSSVYLVSLAGPITARGTLKKNTATVQLMVLHKWSFTSKPPPKQTQSSKARDRGLGNTLFPQLPQIQPFRYSAPAEPDALAKSGLIPTPASISIPTTGKSGYAGPLALPTEPPSLQLPAQDAASLVISDPTSGYSNVSYAAAWALGRQLASTSRAIAGDLTSWHPGAGTPSGELRDWLIGLSELKEVPLEYLIPDQNLLPAPGFRYFELNGQWIQALLDGALSLNPKTQSAPEFKQFRQVPSSKSGFLLASTAVNFWTDIEVEARGRSNHLLPILRKELLQAGMLFCLVDGRVTDVRLGSGEPDFHYGFRVQNTSYILPIHPLRRALLGADPHPVEVFFLDPPSQLCVDWGYLLREINQEEKLAVVPGVMGLELARGPGSKLAIRFLDGKEGERKVFYEPEPELKFIGKFNFEPEKIWDPFPPVLSSPPAEDQGPNSDPISTLPPEGDPDYPPSKEEVKIIPRIRPGGKHKPPSGGIRGILNFLSRELAQDPKHFFRVAHLAAILVLLLSSGGIFGLNRFLASRHPAPLITSFEGIRNVEALKLSEEYYSEIVPVTDKNGKLQFLLEMPATIGGYMDMSQMEYEVHEKNKTVSVMLPPPQLSDPRFHYDEVKELMYREKSFLYSWGGGGKSYSNAYHAYASSFARVKEGVRKSAIKNRMLEDVESKGRIYVMHNANALGYQVRFVERKSLKGLEERVKLEVEKLLEKEKAKNKPKKREGGEN